MDQRDQRAGPLDTRAFKINTGAYPRTNRELLKAQLLLGRAYLLNGQYSQLNALWESQKAIYPDRANCRKANRNTGTARRARRSGSPETEESQAAFLRTAAAAVKDKQFSLAPNTTGPSDRESAQPCLALAIPRVASSMRLGRNEPQAALETIAAIQLNDLAANEQRLCTWFAGCRDRSRKLNTAQESIDVLQRLAGDDQRQGPAIALRAVELAMLRKDRTAADQLAKPPRANTASSKPCMSSICCWLAMHLPASSSIRPGAILNAILQTPPANDSSAVPAPNGYWANPTCYRRNTRKPSRSTRKSSKPINRRLGWNRPHAARKML